MLEDDPFYRCLCTLFEDAKARKMPETADMYLAAMIKRGEELKALAREATERANRRRLH